MDKQKGAIPKSKLDVRENFNSKIPSIRGIGRVGLRRSKSFADINTFCKFGTTKTTFSFANRPEQDIPQKSTRFPNNKPCTVTAKSSSVTNLNAIPSTSNFKTNSVKAALIGTKRPLTNTVAAKGAINKRLKPETVHGIENDNKAPPKTTRAPKPAKYDYKGRFNLLNEKHVKLQTVSEDLKQQLIELKTELDHLKEENVLYIQKTDKLETIEVQLRILKTEYKTVDGENTILKRENSALTKEVNALKECNTIIAEKYDTISKEIEDVKFKLEEKSCKLQYALEQLETFKEELYRSEAIRRKLHNTVEDLKGNIRVFCRIRPALDTECEKPLCSINYIDEATLELHSRDNIRSEFVFDKVFPPESSQYDVFEDLAGLVQSSLDGYNVCVFAYGQTGSGKTYTMQGEPTDCSLGMIPRSIDLLFNTINKLEAVGWEYRLEASFLEIYNEMIRDLLDVQPKQHEIRYNEGKGVTVTNLRIQPIKSHDDFRLLMETAAKYRAVAKTNFNEHSSRSHAVTKIYINGVNKNTKVSYTGSLNLIDLAGSESAKTSSDERLIETKHINRSLSALGNVILALHNKDNFVPFRNSRLTYLLWSCLAGNSKTLMVVNLSPLEECYNETINSLRFAFKVKDVKVNSRRNKTYHSGQD